MTSSDIYIFLQVIFIGDAGVGKTSIFKLYLHHDVFPAPVPTIDIETKSYIVHTKDSEEEVMVRIMTYFIKLLNVF